MISDLLSISFADPWWLLLLVAIPVVWWMLRRRRLANRPSMAYSDLSAMGSAISWRVRLHSLLPWLKIVAAASLIVALARPQQTLTEVKEKAEGIDIMLSIDLSSSMLSKDFDPNRLEVSKKVASDFVRNRVHDRIGLVLFAGESYAQTPLTTDHGLLTEFLSQLQVGYLEDGTAIGMGLATAVNRLKDSQSPSKVIILLTDGVNNKGYIDPETATEIAVNYNVKVYTIGVGSIGRALSPTNRNRDGSYNYGLFKVEIDEALLKDISRRTGGRYFRAKDAASLTEIYRIIDQLEKTEIEVTTYKRYKDMYRYPLGLALLLLVLHILLRNTFLNTDLIA